MPPVESTPAPAGRSQAMDQLERQIQQLRIDYERFFNGALPIPPLELQQRIQGRLRELRNSNLQGVADNFRLSSLEARFNAYHELYGRRLREREEGHGVGAVPQIQEEDWAAAGESLLVKGGVDPAAAQQLYESLCRESPKPPGFDLESFRSYLERQAVSLRRRTGCSAVEFRLAREGEEVKLRVRPVAGRGREPN